MAVEHGVSLAQGPLLYLPPECLQRIGDALDRDSQTILLRCSKAMARKWSGSLESLSCSPSDWLDCTQRLSTGRLAVFAHLLTLNLIVPNRRLCLQREQVTILPATIKTLSLNVAGKKPHPITFPPNVTRLTIGNLHAKPKIVLRFPPLLTSLTLSFRSRAEHLPGTLSQIQHLDEIVIVGPRVVLDESSINQIPASILRLSIPRLLDQACFDFACNRFQKLELLDHRQHLKYMPRNRDVDLENLPPNLTRMSGVLGADSNPAWSKLPRQLVSLGRRIVVFGINAAQYSVYSFPDIGNHAEDFMHEIPPFYESIILFEVCQTCPLKFVTELIIECFEMDQRHLDACRFMSSVQRLTLQVAKFIPPLNLGVCTWKPKYLSISTYHTVSRGTLHLDNFMPWIDSDKLQILRICTGLLHASPQCFLPDTISSVDIEVSPKTKVIPTRLLNKIRFRM